MMQKILGILSFTLLFNACSPAIKEPVRGFWLTNVDSPAMFHPDSLKSAVDAAQRYGFNTIYAVVWNRGHTLYPSQVMEEKFGISIDPKFAGRDPLQELIDFAHPKNIRVVAWFEFGFSSSYREPDGGHILRRYPQWAARDTSGNIVSKNGFQWMNGFDPEVQDFVLELLREVASEYPIDGIQGDDRLPALPSEAGYDSLTLARYREAFPGQAPPKNTKDSAWVQWRANLLSDYMRRIHRELKAIRPELSISVSPSIYPWSKEEYLQDWPTWLARGWVDEVIPQVYRYDIDKYRLEISNIVSDQVSPENRPKVFPGILLKVGDYYAPESFLKEMVAENRKHGLNGEVFFFYEGIKRHPGFFQQLYPQEGTPPGN